MKKHGPNLFYRSVENRLLCCQVRKVLPLQRHLAGLDAWITGLRRDQWATRSDIRKVEIDHDHGAIVKLNPLAEWTEDEVWDYVREHELPYNPLYDKGYTSIGCAPCTRPTQPGEDLRAGRWWWETNAPKECGIHCAIETGGLEHELRALIGESTIVSRSRSRARRARSRSPRRRPCSSMAREDEMRARLAELVAAVDDGGVDGDAAELLEYVLELGLQTGRIRAYYGPGGEQAALPTLRRLPRGRARADSAREVSQALQALAGRAARRRCDRRRRAGRFTLAIEAGGLEARSGSTRNGARLASVGDDDAATTWRASTCAARDCLVVGGGRVAAEKARGLLDVRRATSPSSRPQIEAELRGLPISRRRSARSPTSDARRPAAS